MSEAKNPLKRRWGDRYDGWRVRSNDPFFSVIPHIMNTRTGAQVLFDETVEINELEQFIRNLRHTTSMTELSMLHLLMAAYVRVISQYPNTNRFVCGRKIFARNKIVFCFVMKKAMRVDAEEIIIKVEFSPTDTLEDVYRKVTEAVNANKVEGAQNDTGAAARLFSYCPTFLVKFVVFLARGLDSLGILPKAVNEFSPFHCSLFITDIGSTGLNSVYHHLYDFGTCSVFCCLGKKGKKLVLNDDGEAVYRRSLNLRFTVDERIVDGYYYAVSLRELIRLLKCPETLLTPPESVATDSGIRGTQK